MFYHDVKLATSQCHVIGELIGSLCLENGLFNGGFFNVVF